MDQHSTDILIAITTMRFPSLNIRLCMFLLVACAMSAAAESSQPADLILVNAHVYTVNPQQEWADAIAVRGDKIIAIGEKAR